MDGARHLKRAIQRGLETPIAKEILAGTYQTPLGEIRFTPEGEVIQSQFFVAQVRMDPGGRSGRFALLK